MPANVATRPTGATVLSRALEIEGGEMPPEAARFVLGLGIGEEDRRRMLELLTKQQQGGITSAEREDLELESYIEADNVLSVLKAQALLALKRDGQKS